MSVGKFFFTQVMGLDNNVILNIFWRRIQRKKYAHFHALYELPFSLVTDIISIFLLVPKSRYNNIMPKQFCSISLAIIETEK